MGGYYNDGGDRGGSGMKDCKSIKDVLNQFKDGLLSIEEAEKMLKGEVLSEIENLAMLDVFRELRTGVPEVVFAGSKTVADLEEIIGRLIAVKGDVLVSRITPEQMEMIKRSFPGEFTIKERARIASRSSGNDKKTGFGHVGIITAGTSDIPVAEEAATLCELMGCTVKRVFDIGIAGIHRVFQPLKEMVDEGVDVIICCAGMEGALPSIIASLTDVLVIGVPISTGYGHGGMGETALKSMLQSCAPGLVVVNIDNGIGAGAAAALIARKRGDAGKNEK
ncbi:MAG: nickel pincer cofactor biosynthesis protein LarB [Promethearchaeota archaeon]